MPLTENFHRPPTSSLLSKQVGSSPSSRQHRMAAKPLTPAPTMATVFPMVSCRKVWRGSLEECPWTLRILQWSCQPGPGQTCHTIYSLQGRPGPALGQAPGSGDPAWGWALCPWECAGRRGKCGVGRRGCERTLGSRRLLCPNPAFCPGACGPLRALQSPVWTVTHIGPLPPVFPQRLELSLGRGNPEGPKLGVSLSGMLWWLRAEDGEHIGRRCPAPCRAWAAPASRALNVSRFPEPTVRARAPAPANSQTLAALLRASRV